MERRRILNGLGAVLHLTPAHEGHERRNQKSRRTRFGCTRCSDSESIRKSGQSDYHEATTGPEIWDDLDGRVDAFVAGVGTGGTFTGVSRFLKSRNPDILAAAVEPESSAVLSGRPAGPHKISGYRRGIHPR